MIQYNAEALAYLGDSIYEFKIRTFLLNEGITKVDKLHKTAIKYTSAVSQAKIINDMIEKNFLSETELNTYKRGRNANHSANRRKISRVEYQKSTGFEALIGFLYLSDEFDRMHNIINYAIDFIRSNDNGKK